MCIWQFMCALIYMSGNNFNEKEKENVEAVTESTAPVLAPTSARGQSNSSRYCRNKALLIGLFQTLHKHTQT